MVLICRMGATNKRIRWTAKKANQSKAVADKDNRGTIVKKILSLNDEAKSLGFLHLVIKEMTGCQHIYTTNSLEAVTILCKEPIDLFIQDMVRPDLNGFQLYWLMKSSQKLCDVPNLIITAWSPPPQVTKLELDRKTNRYLYRIEFEESDRWIYHLTLERVSKITNGHIVYVEGYLNNPNSDQIIWTVRRILREGTAFTQEERDQRKQLWTQITKTVTEEEKIAWYLQSSKYFSFDPSDERPDSLKFWDALVQTRFERRYMHNGD
jgi:response regulator RpfG family c-di-GMP phosphodiesterase